MLSNHYLLIFIRSSMHSPYLGVSRARLSPIYHTLTILIPPLTTSSHNCSKSKSTMNWPITLFCIHGMICCWVVIMGPFHLSCHAPLTTSTKNFFPFFSIHTSLPLFFLIMTGTSKRNFLVSLNSSIRRFLESLLTTLVGLSTNLQYLIVFTYSFMLLLQTSHIFHFKEPHEPKYSLPLVKPTWYEYFFHPFPSLEYLIHVLFLIAKWKVWEEKIVWLLEGLCDLRPKP